MIHRTIPMILDSRAVGIAGTLFAAFMSLGSSCFLAAQSTANGGNPGATPSSPEKTTDKPSAQKADKPAGTSAAPATTPTPPKKHVITNDDINGDRARHNDGFDGGARKAQAIPGTGVCDDECADEARAMAGFGPDQDGEWQFALTAARRSLAADTSWPGAYVTLSRAVNQYCTFQQQVQMTAVPSSNDYNSQLERAKRQKYVEDMSRVLGQNVTNANAQIERMAQEAEQSEPARGAIMRVLAQRVNDSCDP
jgi:hypothetical protein